MTDDTDNSKFLSVLKVNDAKFVKIQNVFGRLKLCAVDGQDENNMEPSVKISRRWRNEIEQWALNFKDKSTFYSLKVNENEKCLELDIDAGSRDSGDKSDNYWFEKKDKGGCEYHGLESVANRGCYLYLKRQRRYRIFSISEDKSVLVADNNKK